MNTALDSTESFCVDVGWPHHTVTTVSGS